MKNSISVTSGTVLVLALVLIALASGCNGGEETSPGISGPTPGPIIDIEGDGATVRMAVSGTGLSLANPTTDTLDPRFFLETHAVGLVNCSASNVYYLGKNKTLAMFHTNLTDKAVIKRNTDATLSWSCVVGGNLTTIRPGGDGDVPQCVVDAKGPVFELQSGETGNVIFMQTIE